MSSRPTPSSAAADQLFQQQHFAPAEAAYAALLQAETTHEWAALQWARCAVSMGQGRAARERFAALLKAHPDSFSGWLEAGHLCRQQSALEQALASYQRAMGVAPTRYEAPLSAARLLEELGRSEEGAALYHRASTLVPPDRRHFMHQRMAKFRQERGDVPAALDSLRQALLAAEALQPPLPLDERCEMLIDLGELLLRINARDEAMQVLTQASQATAEATLTRLAQTAFRFNLWQESQAVLQRNVELHPQSASALWNLAHGYAETWEMDLALVTLARAEAIAPQAGARSMRASVAGRLGDVDQALAIYTELAEQEGPLSKMRSSTAMASLYSDKLTPTAVATLHRDLFAPQGKGARTPESFANARDPHKRLRLGLVTADFHHQHPVNIFMQPVLARWNPQDIEITVYFTGVSYDEQTLLAKRRVSHWVEVTTLNDVQLARRIEEDGIDVLLDLAGHTGMQRMAMFAQRAAPVQATFLGYPGSTGVPHIDWILADGVVAPAGSEALFSEQVLRLPHTVFCFSPEADYPFPAFPRRHGPAAFDVGVVQQRVQTHAAHAVAVGAGAQSHSRGTPVAQSAQLQRLGGPAGVWRAFARLGRVFGAHRVSRPYRLGRHDGRVRRGGHRFGPGALQRRHHQLASDVDGRAGADHRGRAFCLAHGRELHAGGGLARVGGQRRRRLRAPCCGFVARPPGLAQTKNRHARPLAGFARLGHRRLCPRCASRSAAHVGGKGG